MKKISLVFLLSSVLIVSASQVHGEEIGIGKEAIKPVYYPKFSVAFEINTPKKIHSFNNSSVRSSFEKGRYYGIQFFSEAGLSKYLNAGLSTSYEFKVPKPFKGPFYSKMALFIKPYFPIGNRFSIFSRVYFGPAIGVDLLGSLDNEKDSEQARPRHFNMIHPGFTSGASLGAEVFFMKRLAIFIEGGFRMDMFWVPKSVLLENNSLERWQNPSWMHYMGYEFPINLGLHFIL